MDAIALTTPISPGWKTTEFWMNALLHVITVLGVLKGIVPAQYVPYVIGALTILDSVYTVSRTFLKQTNAISTTTSGGTPGTVTTTITKP